MKIFNNLDLNDLYDEIWKDIENYNGNYQVSNCGRIKSFKRCQGKDIIILSQNKNNNGYLYVNLCKNGEEKHKQVHRLLFETFNNCKLKGDDSIHHLNENKLDNDLDNLQLMTKYEHNSLHKSEENNPFYGKNHSEKTKQLISEKMSGENHPMYGKKRPEISKRMSGENNPSVKLKERDIIEIRKLLDEGILTQKEIGKLFGVNRSTISLIKNNKIWKHIYIYK